MQQAANLVRGWVECRITGAGPEEFFNQCARQNVGFWRAKQLDATTWTFRVSFWSVQKLEPIAQKTCCELTLLRRGGLPGLLWKLRYRYALLAGMALSLAAVCVLSQFVLTVRVSGNIRVPTGAILSQLRANGLRPGVFGPSLNNREICHSVILELPQLSWMTVNLRGTVAEVLVREGDPPPELVEEDVPAHIVARFTGIITHMETTKGQALVQEGDTVVAGDTLISSWVDFVEPQYYEGDMGGMLVRASGKIQARVWHTLKASMPVTQAQKSYTGSQKTRWSLEILGKSLNFPGKGGITYPKYDKIVSVHQAHLPGGRPLPLSLKKEISREYETISGEIDQKEAETMLRSQLYKRLLAQVEGGEILKTDYTGEIRDGVLTVTLLAECSQEIGMTIED